MFHNRSDNYLDETTKKYTNWNNIDRVNNTFVKTNNINKQKVVETNGDMLGLRSSEL